MDSRFEKVSALMDGELADVRKESEKMESDPELLERWDRYSLVADLMRGDDVAVPQPDLAADFDKALSEEAVYMSPSTFHKTHRADAADKGSAAAGAANEESLDAWHQEGRRLRHRRLCRRGNHRQRPAVQRHYPERHHLYCPHGRCSSCER